MNIKYWNTHFKDKVIKCISNEEVKELFDYLDKEGFRWNSDLPLYPRTDSHIFGNYTYFFIKGTHTRPKLTYSNNFSGGREVINLKEFMASVKTNNVEVFVKIKNMDIIVTNEDKYIAVERDGVFNLIGKHLANHFYNAGALHDMDKNSIKTVYRPIVKHLQDHAFSTSTLCYVFSFGPDQNFEDETRFECVYRKDDKVEVTLSQIAKALNIPVDKLRIKK